MSERHEFCRLALDQGNHTTDLCQRCGISRKTGYKWLKRCFTQGYDGLRDHSHRLHRILHRSDPEIEDMVVHLHHQYPYWGSRKLHALMKDALSADRCPSLSTVRRILKRHGLVSTKDEPVDCDTVKSFARPFPNDLWQMDWKDCLCLSNGQELYPVGILDDHSRYLV